MRHPKSQEVRSARFALTSYTSPSASFAVCFPRQQPVESQARIRRMKFLQSFFATILLLSSAIAQDPKSVTVPITLDHNRVVIDVYLPLPDGTTKRVRAWVNTGSTELTTSQRVGELFGPVKCEAQSCETTPPPEIQVSGMKISLQGMQSHAPTGVPKDVMVAGMSPEISLPAPLLRNYDIAIDYANRQFSIGAPGSLKFQGQAVKARVNPAGLIDVTGQVQSEQVNLLLDTGSGISFVAADRFLKWRASNSTWPYLKGAVGAANFFGTPDEISRELLRTPTIRLGTTALSGIIFASLPEAEVSKLNDRVGADTNGLLGGEAFRNGRVGIDYAHQSVYIDTVNHSTTPDMDVVGLTLHPEANGRFTVLSVLDVDGRPAVPDVKPGDVLVGVDGAPATGATLGQVWSLLGGAPGQIRTLTLERDGKRFTVDAKVHRFLAAKTAVPTKSPRKNTHRRD